MAKKRRKRRVAMATKRRKTKRRKTVTRKEKARRSKISKALKAYHSRQRRQREPLRKVISPEVVRRPEQSLGDFILSAIRSLESQQKVAKFELPEGRAVGGFDMKDQHPDLPRRFERNITATIQFDSLYISDSGQELPIPHYVEFNTGANDEEFWHNYFQAVRDELDYDIDEAGDSFPDDDVTSKEMSVFVARIA